MKFRLVSAIIPFTVCAALAAPASAQSARQGIDSPGSATRSSPRVIFSGPSTYHYNAYDDYAVSDPRFTAEWEKYTDLLHSRNAEGVAWHLTTLAKDGHVWAMREAGAFYAGAGGLANHPEKSLYWYHEAAKNGDAPSAVIVGTAFARGVTVEADPQLARFWLEKAEQSEDLETRRDARRVLASL